MSTMNDSMGLLDSVLLNPKAQKPTIAQRWTRLSFAFQGLVNELNNTSLPWLSEHKTVSVSAGTEDYTVPGSVGKVLFAYANTDNDDLGPITLDFADLAGVSSGFYLFSPLDHGYARDFNELWAGGSPASIALYRENGQLKFRMAPFTSSSIQSVTLVVSKGDWLDGLTADDEMVLPGHHMLAICRAARSLLPGCEWAGDREFNLQQRQQLAISLTADIDEYAQAWMLAKRTMSADQPTYRQSFGGDF